MPRLAVVLVVVSYLPMQNRPSESIGCTPLLRPFVLGSTSVVIARLRSLQRGAQLHGAAGGDEERSGGTVSGHGKDWRRR
jgi:hypothetical protein